MLMNILKVSKRFPHVVNVSMLRTATASSAKKEKSFLENG